MDGKAGGRMKERLAKVMTKKIATLSWNVGERVGDQTFYDIG